MAKPFVPVVAKPPGAVVHAATVNALKWLQSQVKK